MSITEASDNSLQNKHIGFWGRIPLARKLLAVFGMVFIFTLIIAAVTLNGLGRTQTAYENALTQGIYIRKLSDQLEKSLLQAREAEVNFLRYWREQGFDTAYKNYVIPHHQDIADMRADLDQLSRLGPVVGTLSTGNITRVQYEADVASLTQNVDAYDSIFGALVEAHRKKGFDDSTDYESQFRIAAQNMDAGLFYGQAGIEQLKITFLRLRISEKNYVTTASPAYAVEITTFIPLLEEGIKTTENLNPAAKTDLLNQLHIYKTSFDALVALDQQIANYNKDLLKSSTTVEDLTTKINTLGERLATQNVEAARANSAQTYTISILTVFTVLAISLLLAVTLSQQLTGPIIALTNTAREISAGKFEIQAQVNSTDEIGILAETFNGMTSQLRDAFQNLDRRAYELEQRTNELEVTNQQSQKRAQELQTIAEIARYISTEKDLDKLLSLVTRSVSERFGFYHVGIFLLDNTGKFAVLRASNSLGGQEMIRQKYTLEVSKTDFVGSVILTGNPRVVLDTSADTVYALNPDLPETHSEITLPLTARGTTIGAIDVQSKISNAFTDIDVSVLSLLADQIAIAIDNVRLLDETQNSLVESQSLFREYIADAWKTKSNSEILGYRQSLTGGQLITGKAIKENGNHQDDEKDMLAIPIHLRDQVIGTLNISPNNKDRTWSADEIDIIKAVAERLALALDNARLFEETSTRASRERLVSDITTKIRSSNDPQEMIKTAAEELKRALGATRVEVVPKTNNLPPEN